MSRALVLLVLFGCNPDNPDSGPAETDEKQEPIPVEPPVLSTDLGDMVEPEIVATPPGATFSGTIDVKLETPADPDAEIWFTIDGSVPHLGSSTLYTGQIPVTQSTQIRAIAEVNGLVIGTAPTFVALEPSLVGFSSDVPIIVLWSQRDLPVVKVETYNSYTLSAFEPEPGGRVTFPADASLSVRSGLRVRGSSSAGFEKKPYRLEAWDPVDPANVDMDIALLGMPEEADWVLLSPLVFDRALIRNALMYQLSNDIGRYAPRTRFAEVFAAEMGEPLGNDDYVGVYVIVERVERDAERVQITRLEPADIALPELSGGYIFKEDRLGPDDQGFWGGDGGGAFTFQQPFVFVDPDELDMRPEQFSYLAAQIEELGDALASADFTHPQTGRHYDQIIDVDSWIDHHILNVFAKNPDSFRLSGYFHKDRDGLIMAGPLWDFDRTMGCSDDTRAAAPTWWDASNETSDCTFVFEHGFWLGLFRDPDFTVRYWQRWSDLLASDLSVASVFAVIDGMEAELSEAAPRNFAAWAAYPPRGGSFAAEVTLLRDWVAVRHAWATNCLTLPDPSVCIGQ